MRTLIARYSNLNWALADQGLVSGANFATSIMLARFLGLEEFGRFTLALLVVQLAQSIQDTLIISPMMSIAPKQTAEDEPAYYGAVATQQIAFGAAAFLTVWVGVTAAAAIFPRWNIEGLALPLACATTAFLAQDFLRRYFFTHGRGAVAFATDTLRHVGQIVVLFWLFQTTNMNSDATLWVIATLSVIAALSVLPACEPMVWRIESIRATTSRHWHFSKWLVGSVFVAGGAAQFIYIVAGAILGTAAVGALRATQTLMGVINILIMGLENTVPATAARHFHNGGARALKAYVLRVTIFGELATGTIAAVMFVAPDFWLGLAFGSEYSGYGHLLRWWAIVFMLFYLRVLLVAALRAIEQTRPILVATTLSSVFAVAVAYPLIKAYHETGMVIAFLLANFVTVIVMIVALARQFSTGMGEKAVGSGVRPAPTEIFREL